MASSARLPMPVFVKARCTTPGLSTPMANDTSAIPAATSMQACRKAAEPDADAFFDMHERAPGGTKVLQHRATGGHAEKAGTDVGGFDVRPGDSGVGQGLANRRQAKHDVGRLAEGLIAMPADADDVDGTKVLESLGHVDLVLLLIRKLW